MLLSLFAGIDLVAEEVSAASDADGDGLTYGLEYLIDTSPNDPDSDNDGLPDGWEWMHGLDPSPPPLVTARWATPTATACRTSGVHLPDAQRLGHRHHPCRA